MLIAMRRHDARTQQDAINCARADFFDPHAAWRRSRYVCIFIDRLVSHVDISIVNIVEEKSATERCESVNEAANDSQTIDKVRKRAHRRSILNS